MSDWEYKSDAFHRSTGLLCFKNTHFGNWHGTVPSKAGESQTGVALSRNIYQGVFIMLAWDNIDRRDETTSGEDTSHRVNGMAAQSRIIGPMAQCNMKWTQTNKVQDARSRTWDGCLLGFQTPKTTKPSAVGLDLTFSSAMTSLWCGILRLPTINAPATTMSRVNELLTQPLNIMESLELKESVCVFDQVFYVNTADITWKHDQLKNIIFRMVAFHTIPYHIIWNILNRPSGRGFRMLASSTCVWGLAWFQKDASMMWRKGTNTIVLSCFTRSCKKRYWG